ncbi:MAG: LytR C-terminal domain-containing protein [Solirubrobacterales bacterium]
MVAASNSDYEVLLRLPSYVSLAALITCGLLAILYLSQRRDLKRLRDWMEREPGHPTEDLAASEALLDRTEADLEEALGFEEDLTPAPAVERTAVGPPLPPVPAPPPATPAGSGATWVTSERPALDRITTEREALLPHPRSRRLAARVGQPRVLAVIALLAVVLGIVAIFGSERLLRDSGPSSSSAKPGAVVPADVNVAVLNGTSVPGLAGKVGDDVTVNGFNLGVVTNSRSRFHQTVVMYEPHQRRAARRVAHDLGVTPLQPIDRQTEQAAGGADVVVIAGADRAKP